MMVKKSMSKERLLASAPSPFAYHDDAVRISTDGYYWTGFTAGYKPVHIEIRSAEARRWEKFFRSNNVAYAFEGDRKTLDSCSYSTLFPRSILRQKMGFQ